jgi:hypothetical protein
MDMIGWFHCKKVNFEDIIGKSTHISFSGALAWAPAGK